MFKELVIALRPGYTPPNCKALEGELLDKVSVEVSNQTKKKVEGKRVTLIEDGWCNICNDSTCIHSEGKSYFFNTIGNWTNTKNVHYHKSVLQDAIAKAKEIHCDAKAIVTDNAKVMEKAKEFLYNEDNSLLIYGCNVHYLNLLGQDITPVEIIHNENSKIFLQPP